MKPSMRVIRTVLVALILPLLTIPAQTSGWATSTVDPFPTFTSEGYFDTFELVTFDATALLNNPSWTIDYTTDGGSNWTNIADPASYVGCQPTSGATGACYLGNTPATNGFLPNGTWSFQLRFDDNSGNFGDSSEQVTFTSTGAFTFDPTSNFFATNVSVTSEDSSANVSFTSPADTLVGPWRNMYYSYSLDGGNTFQTNPGDLVPISGISNQSFTIPNLTNGITYSIGIAYYIPDLGTFFPIEANTYVYSVTPSVMSSPHIDSISIASSTTLSVAFSPPTSSETVDYYDYSTDGGTTWLSDPANTNSPIAISIQSTPDGDGFQTQSLQSGPSYSIQVRAEFLVNGTDVPGEPSNMVTGTLLSDTPFISASSQAGDGWATIQTTSISGNPVGYDYSLDYGPWQRLPQTYGSTSMTIFGLTNGQPVGVTIRPYFLDGSTGASSNQITVTPDPSLLTGSSKDSPQVLSVAPGNGYLQVMFNPPTSFDPVSYDYSLDGGNTWHARASDESWGPLTIFGLENGKTYHVAIRGRDLTGVGPSSSTLSANPQSQTQILGTGDAFLQSSYAEVGIRPDGAFGSNSVPAGLHPALTDGNSISQCLGFVVDRTKNGFGPTISGSQDFINIDDGDYFCPGSPYEGWGIEYNNQLSRNSDSYNNIQSSGPMVNTSSGTKQSIQWAGLDSNSGLQVTQVASLENSGQSLRVAVTLTNSSGSDLNDVYYQRSVDPDNAHGSTDGLSNMYFSHNVVTRDGYSGNGAQVSAAFLSGAQIYLTSPDPSAHAAVCPGWQTSSIQIYSPSGDYGQQNDGSGNNLCTNLTSGGSDDGDYAISLAWKFDSIANGTTVSLSFSYDLTAQSAALPVAITLPATTDTSTDVTLNALVNASGAESNAVFTIGTNSDLSGNVIVVPASQNPINGSSDTNITAVIHGLVPGKQYYYQVSASNNIGTTTGAIVGFVPIGTPTAGLTELSSLAESSVTLHGLVNPAGGTVSALHWSVSTDPTLNTGVSTFESVEPWSSLNGTAINNSVSGLVTGLSAGIIYYYQLSVTTETGTVVTAIQSFTTPPAPFAGILAATSITPTSAQLHGMVNAFNNTTTSIIFKLANNSNLDNFVTIQATPDQVTGNTNTAVSATATNLTGGSTYYFQLVATNLNGSNSSGVQSFIAGSSPSIANLNTTVSGLSVAINAEVRANGPQTSTLFYVSTDSSFPLSSAIISTAPNFVSGIDSSTVTGQSTGALNPQTTYYVKAVSTNALGSTSSGTSSFTTPSVVVTQPSTLLTSQQSTVHPGDLLSIDVTFSTSMNVFDRTMLNISGSSSGWLIGSVSSGVISLDGSEKFTVGLVSASTATLGTLNVSINDGVIRDTFGNLNLASNSLVINVAGLITHTISLNSPSFGSITPSSIAPVVDGDTPTFDFTPLAGYQIETVTVDGTDVTNSLTFISGQVKRYTFAPVVSDHALVVTFNQISVSSSLAIYAPLSGSTIHLVVNETILAPLPQLRVSGGTGLETVTVTVGSTLPPGLQVETNGTISGTPSSIGTTFTSFTLTDSLNETASVTVSFVVESATVSNPPLSPILKPIPDPAQRSRIDSTFPLVGVVGTEIKVTFTGNFPELIRNITFDGRFLPTDYWIQSESTVVVRLPNRNAGIYPIQIFNGAVPVLKLTPFTFVNPPLAITLPLPVKTKTTYLRCVSNSRKRIVFGVNPVCPTGYSVAP